MMNHVNLRSPLYDSDQEPLFQHRQKSLRGTKLERKGIPKNLFSNHYESHSTSNTRKVML